MSVLAHARLELPFDQLKTWLINAPIFEDRGRMDPDGSLHLTFGIGTVLAKVQEDHSALVLTSPDAASLQFLRDYISDTASEAGVSPIWQERHSRGKPANFCLARVEKVEQVSPSFRRLWLEGADLSALLGKGLHFRLLLGPKGEGWPWVDERGLTLWPGGAGVWHRPVYTVRSLESGAGTTRISVDVFLHKGGRVTEWSEGLQGGEAVGLMGPSGGDVPEGSGLPTPWFGLFGDETALPAIARILGALPVDAVGEAVILVPLPEDEQVLRHPAGIKIRWLHRRAGGDLTDIVAQTQIPRENRFVFFAAGSRLTVAARQILAAKGLSKAEFWAQSYWQDG
ncbi:siderophore-interacting protein [Neogemmobacter tilapiae]|uniref:Siderophore-interacting protein n=1 Tax=Neogemmobacter tilapiae TaxID=875041 RepID=A0A918TRT1_9RHOB|nr:siderophore-interacting protein [Gemmobacter tilapiae]GHC60307.1 siderophore-interacting protein [Gemmobacter tilapiae]